MAMDIPGGPRELDESGNPSQCNKIQHFGGFTRKMDKELHGVSKDELNEAAHEVLQDSAHRMLCKENNQGTSWCLRGRAGRHSEPMQCNRIQHIADVAQKRATIRRKTPVPWPWPQRVDVAPAATGASHKKRQQF